MKTIVREDEEEGVENVRKVLIACLRHITQRNEGGDATVRRWKRDLYRAIHLTHDNRHLWASAVLDTILERESKKLGEHVDRWWNNQSSVKLDTLTTVLDEVGRDKSFGSAVVDIA